MFWFIGSRDECTGEDMFFFVSHIGCVICDDPYTDPTVGQFHLIQLCSINGKYQYHIIWSNISMGDGFKIIRTMINVIENGDVSPIGFYLCNDGGGALASISDVSCTLFCMPKGLC